MTPKEAIEILMSDEKLSEIEYYGGFEGQKKVAKLYSEAFDMAIEAIKKVEDYKAQWIDDMDNPLEPLKLSSALDSEIFKLKYRMENKPKDISVLDYTIIAALHDCLKRYSKGSEDK